MQERHGYHLEENACPCGRKHSFDHEGHHSQMRSERIVRCQREHDRELSSDVDAGEWLSPISPSGWHRSLAQRYSVHARTLTE